MSEQQEEYQPPEQFQGHDANAVGLQLDPNQLLEEHGVEDEAVPMFTPVEELIPAIGLNDGDIQKLLSLGVATIEQTLHFTDKAILATGLSDQKLKKLRQLVQGQFSGAGFVSGNELLQARGRMALATTGSAALDRILTGGLEPGSLTEVYGEFNTGKTQLCHTVCVTSQLPREFGGTAGRVLYIDTEGTFRPERILEIAASKGLDGHLVLENIQVARALSSDHQKNLLLECAKLMAVDRFSVIIVDSVTSLFRTDYAGRGQLSDRQVALGKFLRDLHGLAHTFNVVVLITNQVVSDIAGAAQMGNGQDNKKPIGGNILAHASTTRLQFRKGRGAVKIARIVDSPLLADAEARFTISGAGIGDDDQGE